MSGAGLALGAFVALVLAQRLVELRLARRNEAWARSRGALEHGRAHYPLFIVLHAGWIAGLTLEALALGPALAPGWPWFLGAYLIAQAGRAWAIASLGPYWNTRILVVPGHPLVRSGPYRFLRHPNYLVVAIELAAGPLVFGAWRTALIASLLNAALLLLVRIPAEEHALGSQKAR